MSLYDDLQPVATDLLTEFAQGVIVLRRQTVGQPDPAHPYDPPATQTTDVVLQATARMVQQKYVDGETVVATDKQVVMAVPTTMPTLADSLVIDGVVLRIKRVLPVPAAGTTVAIIVFAGK